MESEVERRYLREASVRAASGETRGELDSSALSAVAARRLLGELASCPSGGDGAGQDAAEREGRYLSWAAVREAEKTGREKCVVPRDAYLLALSSRRFLSAYLWAVPLGELEEELRGVPLPGYARVILKNRRIRRGAMEPSFTGAPVVAQAYLRDPDTVEALRELSSLSGLPESAVAKEAVRLGARAMAGALAPRVSSAEAVGAVDADTRMKELAARIVAEATEKFREDDMEE